MCAGPAGSLVNYLLGVSGVDPLRHNLLMERFLSPLREALPDIDVDVESARREEVYRAILDRFGGERCVTVSMMDTYRVRHAVRDVGAALGMPPGEVDAIAKAFPHIRARDARQALRELPAEERGWDSARRTVQCQSCKAVSVFDAQRVGQNCDFCGSPNLVDYEEIKAPIRPQSLLPFKITESHVREQIRRALFQTLPERLPERRTGK